MNMWILNVALLFVVLGVLLSGSVASLGVAPSREMMNYDNVQHMINIRIINNEHKDLKVSLYADGELAQYAQLPKDDISIKASEDERQLSYSIRLPEELSPGTRNLSIHIVELSDNLETTDQSIVLSTVSVSHQLKVNVPYPGVYLDGVLYISQGNVNDTIIFTANVINRGKETIKDIEGELVIRGPTNEVLHRIRSSSLSGLAPSDAGKIVVGWPADVNPGSYYAEFVVNYDSKQTVLRKVFMVGVYNVEINSLSVKGFKLGSVAKFDIDIVNIWNEPLDDVYGEVQVLDSSGNVVNTFRTGAVQLNSLTSSQITAFWDTEGMEMGTYDVRVILHYSGKTSERIFRTVVSLDSISILQDKSTGNVLQEGTRTKAAGTNLLVVMVIALIVINLGWLIYFKFLRKKDAP